MPHFTGVDFYNIESLLSEEERAIRDTVRAWVDEHLMPVIGDCYVAGRFPKELIPGMAELGILRRQPAGGLRMRRSQQRRLRAHHAGAGAGRQRHPVLRVGPGGTGDVPDLRLRVGGAASPLAAGLAAGTEIGCFGLTEPDFGSNPGGHDHHGPRDGRGLGA